MQTSHETLAKEGTSKEHSNTLYPHEFAHSTPYYYQRDDWPSMETTPDKGPIRFIKKNLTKYDKNINLERIPYYIPT